MVNPSLNAEAWSLGAHDVVALIEKRKTSAGGPQTRKVTPAPRRKQFADNNAQGEFENRARDCNCCDMELRLKEHWRQRRRWRRFQMLLGQP